MRVTQVNFDEDGDVEYVWVAVESKEEVEYLSPGYQVLGGLQFPINLRWSAFTAAETFHAAGKVPGTDERYAASETVYYALLPVVDRLIEYDL